MEGTPGPSVEEDERRYSARLRLAAGYQPAASLQPRDPLAGELAAALASEGLAAVQERILTWISDAPETDLAESPDYLRYRRLLPARLADLLPRSSPDYLWFDAYLDRCPACRAEFARLRDEQRAEDHAVLAILERGHGKTGGGGLDKVAEDAGEYNAYTEEKARRVAAIWRGGFSAHLRTSKIGRDAGIKIELEQKPPRARPATGVGETEIHAAVIDLMRDKAVLWSTSGGRSKLLLTASLMMLGAFICRLRVSLSGVGPGTPDLSVVALLRGGQRLSKFMDPLGNADFEVPIEDLPGLTLTINSAKEKPPSRMAED